MRTIELTIRLDDDLHEWLIAELADLDFGSFVRGDGALKAYIPAPRWNDAKREAVERWLHARGHFAPLTEREAEEENWNANWERTIQPQRVGPFLIKPTWAEAPPEDAGRLLLEIDPKMSFGTGYHASTRLALLLLRDVVQGGERVLDAGTGTGILAIAAVRLGAQSGLAFDTDEWAQQNAVENLYLNRVADSIEFRAGSIDVIAETGFDLILANINRAVLLGFLPVFREKMAEGARVILSGLLRTDRAALLEAAAREGLAPTREAEEDEWWAVVLAKGE